jgi:AbrB family looped-hinge helix DNA binding protein
MSTKGRITIPAKLREQFGFKPGKHIEWSKENGRLALTSAARQARSIQRRERRIARQLNTDH